MGCFQLFCGKVGKVLLDCCFYSLLQNCLQKFLLGLCDVRQGLVLLNVMSKVGMYGYLVFLLGQLSSSSYMNARPLLFSLPSLGISLSSISRFVFGSDEDWFYIVFRNRRISFRHVFPVLLWIDLNILWSKNAARFWTDKA